MVHFVKQTGDEEGLDEEHREVLQEAQMLFCKNIQVIILPI